jgi:hypothetical protein
MNSKKYARGVVFGTLKDFVTEPQVVTRKTKLSTVLGYEVRADFINQLNEKLPTGRRLDPSQGYFTVGQVVDIVQRPYGGRMAEMSASTLPGGKDPTEPPPADKPRPR